MNRNEILSKASDMVSGQREEDYGTPEDNFRTIAEFWSAYLSTTIQIPTALTGKQVRFRLAPSDVAAMMVLLKTARLAKNPAHLDSWIDLAGYAACGGEIVTKYDDEPEDEWPMIAGEG